MQSFWSTKMMQVSSAVSNGSFWEKKGHFARVYHSKIRLQQFFDPGKNPSSPECRPKNSVDVLEEIKIVGKWILIYIEKKIVGVNVEFITDFGSRLTYIQQTNLFWRIEYTRLITKNRM